MRRHLVATGALALLTAAAPFASGATAPSLLPKAGCNVISDPADDQLTYVSTEEMGANGREIGLTAHNWDITGVSYRLSSGAFSVVTRVPGLQDGAIRGTGDSWTASFTVNGKAVVLRGNRNFEVAPRVSGAWFSQVEKRSSATVGGAAAPFAVSVDFNKGAGFVIFTVDRAALEKSVGTIGTLSALSVSSFEKVGPAAPPVAEDSATGGDKTVKATDNTCFV